MTSILTWQTYTQPNSIFLILSYCISSLFYFPFPSCHTLSCHISVLFFSTTLHSSHIPVFLFHRCSLFSPVQYLLCPAMSHLFLVSFLFCLTLLRPSLITFSSFHLLPFLIPLVLSPIIFLFCFTTATPFPCHITVLRNLTPPFCLSYFQPTTFFLIKYVS